MIEQQKNEGVEAFQGKATLILLNTMGLPIVRHIRVLKAQLHSNEYQCQTLRLIYIERMYRKRIDVHFTDNEVAIAHGWQTVQGAFNTFEQTVEAAAQQGEVQAVAETEWTAFEPTAFQAMLSQLTDILYIQAKPTQAGAEA
ncbi:hypothetical protein [Stenomitos frigidus]|uniref:Uncharacterized protein n=1 Tax=Stenomitos frigidus ULC18 TaxID=2107698 RepID=A0A2T1E806_9CYAN|nr:hypothetical protein [Stenomitos frigidus]PSB28858.1 hypothetical protein C7B82_12465 [Stenomitos frigidus ULC18]